MLIRLNDQNPENLLAWLESNIGQRTWENYPFHWASPGWQLEKIIDISDIRSPFKWQIYIAEKKKSIQFMIFVGQQKNLCCHNK